MPTIGMKHVLGENAKIWSFNKIYNSYDMSQSTLGLENSSKFMAKIWACSYYMLQSTLGLENSPNLWQKYEPVAITCCSQT